MRHLLFGSLPVATALAAMLPWMMAGTSHGGMDESVVREFQAPSNAYRGKPFWSWNGKLGREELLRQIGVIRKMGFGGFFMHSRTGLATEYLGDDWFELINACADEAERLGLEAWLYDEDRWPSGSAGGIVTRDPRYRTRYLRLTVVPGDAFEWSDDLVAAFACTLDEVDYRDCRRISKETPRAEMKGKSVLAFTVQEMAKNSFYNGFTYLDTLNPEATRRFLEVTHQQYKARCGDRLGRSIRGIFTDEPHRGMVMSSFGDAGENPEWLLPWTGRFAATFRERFGYDLIDRLPELFLRPEGRAVSQVKWHYMENLQQMFLDNFLQPINAWCEENGVILTGHVLHEDALSCQAVPCGSVMRCYEHLGYPGVDILTEGNRNYWVAKQLDSAANQLGRKWRLSELYGVTGWQFNFESHKAVGDWQALLGVNLRCHHLSWYTMGGEAKRDYPASILHQSAWYPHYGYVEDYFSRLNVLVTQGRPACDVLVVNPVESLWCQIRPGWVQHLSSHDPALRELEKAYQDLFHWLAGAHVDFDYGDEDHIDRFGKVDAADGGPAFRLGQMAYRVVIVPRMTTIRSTTLDRLEAFARAGGTVLVTDPAPEFVDALSSDRAKKLAQVARSVPFEQKALVEACTAQVPPVASVVDPATGEPLGEIFCRARAVGDDLIVVAMNVNRQQAYRGAAIRVRARGSVEEWDCVTGRRFAVPARQKGDDLEIVADFLPSREHAYVIRRDGTADLPPRPAFTTVGEERIEGPFDFELDEPNVCVLDRASYRLDDEPWQEAKEILQVDRAIRTRLGLDLRGGQMLQPWFSAGQEHPVRARLALRFGFEVERLPKGPVHLVVETPDRFEVLLNGRKLDPSTSNGWWIDKCFVQIPVPADVLQAGANTVELRTGFHEGVDLEALYLLGRFGVRVDGTKRTLIELPDKLAVGTITEQGLPFYSGAIRYRLPAGRKPAPGEEAKVRLDGFEAACVLAGGTGPDHVIAWQPYEADVTEALGRDGSVELAVVLTRRNTFGPLHLVPMRSAAYGPGHWITGGKAWTDNYQLWPAGLLQPPRLVYLKPAPPN